MGLEDVDWQSWQDIAVLAFELAGLCFSVGCILSYLPPLQSTLRVQRSQSGEEQSDNYVTLNYLDTRFDWSTGSVSIVQS
ncbi:hypothetical protein TNCV_615571 [Trichonephila clavipes]|nr:hypothetical protein TNCV_615571 [Trichonephila clavipes]